MARQIIGTGSSPNDGTGDNLRAGATKINDNFTELYDLFGNGTTLSSGTWDIVSSGINTLSDVGIGTTNPRFTLEVGAVGASGTSLHVNGDARITGIISTTQVIIGGETLTGAGVTSLVAGSNITLSGSTGQVTINASGGGGSAGVGGTWSNYDGVTGVTTTKKVKIQNDLEVTGVTTSTGGFVGTLDGIVGGNSPAAITGTTITANTNFSGDLTGDVTGTVSGNAGSATVLASSRNIGGVAFNGSADIDLPGVNQAGNQDTSGTAAIATNVTVTDESTDTICFPLFTTDATGDLPPKSGTNLTFNSNNGTLSTNNIAVTDITCNSIINNAGGGATWSLFNTGNATFSGTVTAGSLEGGINASGISTFSGSTRFTGGIIEKYENAGTTLGAQTDNPLSDGNVILFTGNESGNTTINFTGVHSTLSNGETVSFTAIITPNNSGVINVVQVDGEPIAINWAGGAIPIPGATGKDVYTFQIFKTGTGVSGYAVFGSSTNYA